MKYVISKQTRNRARNITALMIEVRELQQEIDREKKEFHNSLIKEGWTEVRIQDPLRSEEYNITLDKMILVRDEKLYYFRQGIDLPEGDTSTGTLCLRAGEDFENFLETLEENDYYEM